MYMQCMRHRIVAVRYLYIAAVFAYGVVLVDSYRRKLYVFNSYRLNSTVGYCVAPHFVNSVRSGLARNKPPRTCFTCLVTMTMTALLHGLSP